MKNYSFQRAENKIPDSTRIKPSSAVSIKMSLFTELTSIGLNTLFDALMPNKINGNITGKLKTGAKNPAWFAFEAIAPMNVNIVEIPPVTRINIFMYAKIWITGMPIKNPNRSKLMSVSTIIVIQP